MKSPIPVFHLPIPEFFNCTEKPFDSPHLLHFYKEFQLGEDYIITRSADTTAVTVTRGSEWGKWDLHVHTPMSFESQYGITGEEREMTDPLPELEAIDTPEGYDAELWAKYIHELEEIEEIDTLGITDYFSIEGYELIEHLRDEDYLENFDLILPNIEFRLDTFTGEDRRVNLHVIFSDDLSASEIKREFLSNLTIKMGGGEEWSLSRDSLCELGRRAKEYHGEDDLSDYVAGCKYATVDFDEITDQLQSSPSLFEGNYLIVLAEAEWADIRWESQDAEERRRLLQDSHGLFSGNPNTREWASGEGDLPVEEFENIFGSLKPVLHGSDSHDFENLCVPDEDRYCWLKAETSFDGLKQVVFEPTDRVHIGAQNPASFTPIHTIESVNIEDGYVNQQLEIEDSEISFNPNLVTIIGSQGHGKTALLDLIANCFQIRSSREVDDDNSFIGRIEDSDPRIRTTIEFAGEDVESFTKEVLDLDTVEGPNILYLPQGKIVEYCRNETHLHERVLDLVKRSVGKDIPDVMNDFQSKENQIEELANELRRLNSELYEINPPGVQEEKARFQQSLNESTNALENKNQEIEEFKENHEEELEETEAEELQDELDELISEAEGVKDFEEDIATALDHLDNVEEFNSLIQDINDQAELVDSDIEITPIDFGDRQQDLEELVEETEAKSGELDEEIEEIRTRLEDLSEVDEELSDLLEEKRRLENEIAGIESRLDDIKEQLGKIDRIKEDRRETFANYVKAYLEWRVIFVDIAEAFSEDQTEILRGIELEPKIILEEDLSSEYVELLDMRTVNEDEITEGLYELRGVIEDEEPDDPDEAVQNYLDSMEKFRSELTSSAEQIEFDGLLYGDYLDLREEIYFQDTPMDQLSRGQKGTVLLKIYLAEGESPLIIDTPEENLDNRFVFEELIDAVRKAKETRQVFIATHDANLVVNTDSEQVVIAKFEEGTVRFEGGPLEDEYVRDEAKDILEGGDEAFRKREEKYHLTPE